MKIVVIGGSGLIGRKLIPLLRERGQEAVSASLAALVGSAPLTANSSPSRTATRGDHNRRPESFPAPLIGRQA